MSNSWLVSSISLPSMRACRRAGSTVSPFTATGRASSPMPAAETRGTRAAQQRADARDELAHAERLGQIVVGAAFEAEHFVGLLAARGQHEYRHVAVGGVAADGAADGDAVEPREHQIEDHQIERLGAREAQPLVAIADRDGLQALERKCSAMRSRMCGSSSTTRTRAPDVSRPRSSDSMPSV